jgi:hypothetical protein
MKRLTKQSAKLETLYIYVLYWECDVMIPVTSAFLRDEVKNCDVSADVCTSHETAHILCLSRQNCFAVRLRQFTLQLDLQRDSLSYILKNIYKLILIKFLQLCYCLCYCINTHP